MKVVILCGGKGTRMREETEYRPKPLVNIGGKPILWHIMKLYSSYGYNDFVLCVGYKGEMIKAYFMEIYWRNNDFTVEINHQNNVVYHTKEEENWKITIVDTGSETQTAGRIKKIKPFVEGEPFMLTYGDGLSDINIEKLLKFHHKNGKVGTLTGVHPTSTFGLMEVENGLVKSFKEKPVLEEMVNGGYMVMQPEIFDVIPEEDCALEDIPLVRLAQAEALAVYEHTGFWKAIDTHKDVLGVERMCKEGDMPWIRNV